MKFLDLYHIRSLPLFSFCLCHRHSLYSLTLSFSPDFNEQLRSESVDSSTRRRWLRYLGRIGSFFNDVYLYTAFPRENLISLNNDAVHRSFSDDEDNGNDKGRLGRGRGWGRRSIVLCSPFFLFFFLFLSSNIARLVSPPPASLFKIQSLDFNPFAVLLTL